MPFNSTSATFSNPFMSLANRWMPTTMKEVFELCEWMYRFNGIYRGALERAARLFYTEYRFETSENTILIETIKNFLVNKKDDAIDVAIDYLVYGNSIAAIYLPFKRSLRCPKCENTFLMENMEGIDFSSDGSFYGDCPSRKCGNVTFAFRDVPDKDIKKINIIRIPADEVEIIGNKYSGHKTYFWNISSLERNRIKSGKGTILISETPSEILNAIYKDGKVKFKDGEILHLKQSTLSGTDIDWGMPFALSCFPLIFYIAILRKANEAISMDYIIPLRIIFPESTTSYQEASFMNLGNFVSKIKTILDHHKQDPDDWQICPTRIGYQVIGGEKRSLMISDDIKLSNEELLNSIGFPAEFFYGTLGLQSTPMALRLLDNSFGLTEVYNKITSFLLDKVTKYLSLEPTQASMTPLRWIDDMERRQMIIQLAAANKVSDITVLELYGLDYQKEQERKIQQMQILKEIDEKASKKNIMDQQTGSSPEASGTPMDLMQQAQGKAEQLVMMPDAAQREMQLRDLLKTNPLLHDAVMGSMERARNKMRTQGMNMMIQQQQQ